MPDTTVEPGGSGPYDRPVDARVSRLEEQMSDLKPILARIEAVLPHLATAAQVADLKGDLDSIGALSGGFRWEQGGPDWLNPAKCGALFLGKESTQPLGFAGNSPSAWQIN